MQYVGEGEKVISALFDIAREHQPAVIFVDEIDSLLSKGTKYENAAARRLTLSLINGVFNSI